MPVTPAGAALTDRYRDVVLSTRTSAGLVASAGLAGLDLDLSSAQLAGYLLRWAAASALTTAAAQARTAALSGSYLGSYLVLSGTPSPAAPPVDLAAHVGRYRDGTVDDLLAGAGRGLLWRLGQGAGREAAVGYGQALAARGAGLAVADAARDTLTDLMVASPEVVGYRRVTSARTCRRCAVAAERTYHAEVLLPRHPNCHCSQEPVLRTLARFARPVPAVVRP